MNKNVASIYLDLDIWIIWLSFLKTGSVQSGRTVRVLQLDSVCVYNKRWAKLQKSYGWIESLLFSW